MADLQVVGADGAVVQPDLMDAFAEFLRLDVANSDASEDTKRAYWTHVKAWVDWCQGNGIEAAHATHHDVKVYREYLNHYAQINIGTKEEPVFKTGYSTASIAQKLTIIRRFYAAAVDNGLRPDNPAAGVKPPKTKRAQDDFHYLSEVDYTLLIRAVGNGTAEKELRDKAIVAMMGLQGLRTVEIERANVNDLRLSNDAVSMTVRGKGHDRIIYLRPDVADVLTSYLDTRREVWPDDEGTPMFTACGNRAGGKRISRRGVRQVVDFYLKKADLKRPGISDHALRHTAATLAYKYTQDLRGVQEMLGHADPKTTARYAHVIDRMKNNPAMAIQVEL